MSVYNQSNTTFNFAASSNNTVNGSDDVINVGDDSTLDVNGHTDIVYGSYGTLMMDDQYNTVDGVGNQITVANNSQLVVNGGGNTISQSHGYLAISGSSAWADRISGTVLELTVLDDSHYYINGTLINNYLGSDVVAFATGDNTNFFGSDDKIHMTGANVGGDAITGDHDVAFVAAQSQLLLDGNYTIVRADDHSSLAVTGNDDRLIGADFSATASKGSEVWMGGNGVNGVDDTLTASNITATIGGNSNVILHGDDDVATIALDSYTYFVGEGLTAHVGNHATIDINVIDGSGETGALDVLTGGVFNAIVATSANVELDTYEATATLASNVALAVEKSGNVIHAGGTDTIAIRGGVSNQVFLGTGDIVTDAGYASTFEVSGNVGATRINNLGHVAIVDLLNGEGGYSSAQDAFSSLTSDGNGGLTLSLGSDGSIDFAGSTSLSAANFKIG